MRERLSNEERFWSLVSKTGECWAWAGARLRGGYGVFDWHDGTSKRTRTTHRISYELAHGPIPEGMMVLHTCDNRGCVRPEHLYLGTHAENMRDMTERKRAATGEHNGKRLHPDRQPRGDSHHARQHPERLARGEANGNTKLNSELVRQIRRRYNAGGVLLRELAAEFNCPLSTVHQIVTRKTWKHIT